MLVFSGCNMGPTASFGVAICGMCYYSALIVICSMLPCSQFIDFPLPLRLCVCAMTLYVLPLRYNVTLRRLCYECKVWHMSALTQYFISCVHCNLSHSAKMLKLAPYLWHFGTGIYQFFLRLTTWFGAIMTAWRWSFQNAIVLPCRSRTQLSAKLEPERQCRRERGSWG